MEAQLLNMNYIHSCQTLTEFCLDNGVCFKVT